MAVAYVAIAVYGTWSNFVALHLASLGMYDLSINQQALSSTVHGNYPYAFYEATNCGRNDRCSFLLVHPVFAAYLVAIPYALAPSALTLYVIQDVALALAAFPLFLLTRTLSRSTRLALLAAGVYLVWVPAFSGIFSFHWEAFMPLEMFTIFYLWLQGRFWTAVPLAVLTYVTLEIGSVFLFCLGAFFLLPWVPPFWGYLRARLRVFRMVAGSEKARLLAGLVRIRRNIFRARLVRASIGLMIMSFAAYVLLHEFVTRGGWLLGLPPLPAEYQIPLDQPVHAATFTLGNFLYQWNYKLLFWLIIFATLGALPLLAPKTIVLWGPWLAYTTLSTSGFYHIGDQYGFLSAAVLFLGFVYGLLQLQRWANGSHLGTWWTRFWKGGDPLPDAPVTRPSAWSEAGVSPALAAALAELDRVIGPAPTGAAPTPEEEPSPRARLETTVRRRRRRSWRIIGCVIAVVVVANMFLNPLNPYSVGLRDYRPFAAHSQLGLTGFPNTSAYTNLEKLIALIPANAVVGVSPSLLSFVSSDPHAYPLLNDMDWQALPFTAEYPLYVVLAEHVGTHIPPFLKDTTAGNYALYNSGTFGIRAWIPSTPLGGILLFQRGYTGSYTTTYGTAPTFVPQSYAIGSGLNVSASGTAIPNGTSGNTILSTISYANHTVSVGRIGEAGSLTLTRGTYEVSVAVSGYNVTIPSGNGTTSVGQVRIAGYEDPIATYHVNWTLMNSSGWKVVTFEFSIQYPVLAFTVLLSSTQSWFVFQVASVSVSEGP